jgi:hypothetical protein
MAQVLQRQSDYDSAITRFILVCEKLERTLECDPSSVIDVRYAIFSLAAVADIYALREDWSKSLAFRECEQSFLHYLDDNPDIQFEDRDDDILPDFTSVATNAYQFLRLFQKIHEAVNIPNKISETPDQTAERAKATLAAEQKAQTAEVIRLLTEPLALYKAQISNSFWRRNFERVLDHPFIVGLILSVLAVVIIVLFHRNRRRVAIRHPGEHTREAARERLVKAKNSKKAKMRKTVRPAVKDKIKDQAREDLYEI